MSETVRVEMSGEPGGELLSRIQLLIASGGTVVYPTRTLYGIGAGISSINGIVKVLKIKDRPYGPVTVMLNRYQLTDLVDVPIRGKPVVDSGLPITFVLPAKPSVSSLLTEQDGSLAVRIADSRLLRAIIQKVGPITSTSANLAGGPDPTDASIAREQLGDMPDLYLDAGPIMGGGGSTIVDLRDGAEAKIIRQGSVSEEEVRTLYGK